MEPLFRKIIPLAAATAILACAASCATKDRSKAIHDSGIAFDLGVSYLNSNQPRMALEQFEKAVRDNPEYPEAYNALGLIYFGIHDYTTAEKNFRKAIELRENYSDAMNNLGRLYLDEGKPDQAIEQFRKALSNLLYQTPQFATLNLGWAYYQKGMRSEALEQFRKAATIDPRFCLAYRSMGIIRMEMGDGLEARRAFDKFKENCAASPEPYYRLAEVNERFKLAPPDEIMADLEHSIDLDKNFCPARLLYGRLLKNEGRYSEALEALERYFGSCHEAAGADAFLLIGAVYSALRFDSKASVYFTSCARKWPDTPDGRECAKLLGQNR